MTNDTHQTYTHGPYCHNHNATFEPQEATRNNDDCPWCGESVVGLFE